MTQPKDTPDLLQASGEPFLALAEAPSAFHSRSSLILGQLRSVEAQFRSFWGVERLGKVPQDLQQSWVAVGHQSQRQLKLLRLCISSLEALAAGTNCSLCTHSGPPPSPPSLNPKGVFTRWVSTATVFSSAVTRQETEALPAWDSCQEQQQALPSVPGKHSPISDCTGLSVLNLSDPHHQNRLS